MVDVTVLLYLPINTSLDDLAFVADWGQKIVAAAEEKMIINGKNTRYLRQRVMPMMYNPNNEIRPVNQPKTRQNTESWLKLLKKQEKEALPSWVKNHDLLENKNQNQNTIDEKEEEDIDNPKHRLAKQNIGNSYETTNDHKFEDKSKKDLCECAPNRKNYLDVIREAVHFTYIQPETSSCFTDSQTNLNYDSEQDSIFSDDDPISPKSNRKSKKVRKNSIKNSFKNGSNNSIGSHLSKNSNDCFSVKSKYSSFSNHEILNNQHRIIDDIFS
jgi:hypothetical protein